MQEMALQPIGEAISKERNIKLIILHLEIQPQEGAHVFSEIVNVLECSMLINALTRA